MSNLDPFTQKLLQRTQARKDARLKRQLSSEVAADCTASPEKKFDSSAQPRIPLAEKNLSDEECGSSTSVRNTTNKKRQSSEDFSLGVEKKLRSCNSNSATPTNEENSTGLNRYDSPIQRVTVQASVQESPKHNVKSSLASRLSRLTQQYSEQFEVDAEDEKRRKEATSVWEVRAKEHQQKQEEERAHLIQERIFGKDYVKQREEEKRKLTNSPAKSPAKLNIKQTEGGRLACTNANSPSKLRNEKDTIAVVQVKGGSSSQLFENHDSNGMVVGVHQQGEMEKKEGVKKRENPQVATKPPVKSHKPEILTKDKLRKNSLPVNDETNKDVNPLKLNEEEGRKRSASAVQDKKSIFEEKMKKESVARNKEMEADERLQKRSWRKSAAISSASEIPANTSAIANNTPTAVTNNTPTAVTNNTPTAITNNKPTAVTNNTPTAVINNTLTAVTNNTPTTVTNNIPTANHVPTLQTNHQADTQYSLTKKACETKNECELEKDCGEKDFDKTNTETWKKKSVSNIEPVTDFCNGKVPTAKLEPQSSSAVDHLDNNVEKVKESNNLVSSSKSSIKNLQTDKHVLIAQKDYPVSTVESPVQRNFDGDISSPQPADCTEDTLYSLSETQAFDVSAILRAAHHEEQQLHLKSERVKPNRCSTMKVEPDHLAMVDLNFPELNMTPIQQNESANDESLSEFAKAIRNKVKSIKSPEQIKRLDAIDIKMEARMAIESTKPSNSKEKREPSQMADDKTSGDKKRLAGGRSDNGKKGDAGAATKSREKHPAKPPRVNKNLAPTEIPRSNTADCHQAYTPTGGLKSIKEKHYSADCEDYENFITKPSEKISRKKMRRSSSFSEGQTVTPVKSGYNRGMSEDYNASCSDKPDMVHSKKDQIQNLLEEAACQQNIVLQASQALNVAECSNEDKSNTPEVLEGERLLLLATERRTVCLEEVKALKESNFEPVKERDLIPPCKATLALADIKLPLHHHFVNSLKNGKRDVDMFHFVIIISAGNKNVYSTKIVSCFDEMEDCTLITKSNIVMKNVPHDFTLSMKVFGMHSGRNNDQITKIRKNNNNNPSSPSNLKSLFSKRNKEEVTYYASPQTVFRTSNFKLIGETKVNLNLLGNGVNKYMLTKVPTNCPIDGTIQLRATCKPEFSADISGFLTILEDVGGYTAWNRRWCTMQDSKILYWRYPDDEKDKEAMGSIDLRYCVDKVMKLLARDICARPQTFELNLKRASLPTDRQNLITTMEGKVTKIKCWVCCDNKDDRITWMDTINVHLSDSRAWKLKKITVKSPTSPVKSPKSPR